MDKLKVKVTPYRCTSDYYRKSKKLKINKSNVKEIPNTSMRLELITHDETEEHNIDFDRISDRNIFQHDSESSESENETIIQDDQLLVINNQITFLNELKEWALVYKLTHSSVTALLNILRSNGLDHIPKSSKTLLKTPRAVEIINMGVGQYWYNGIKSSLMVALENINCSITISLKFNIDGMAPFKSSSLEFWPILFLIDEMPHINPMVAAVYYGQGKPPLNQFLTPFVEELNILLKEGFYNINKHKVNVCIKCFICDTPARCFIKGVAYLGVAYIAEYGACIKCTVVGEWDKQGRHMSYAKIDCPERTNENFRNKIDEDHHKVDTPLTALPIDLIDDIIIADSLHLLDLGIMRKCIYAWCNGSYNYRSKLSANNIEKLSNMLLECNKLKPVEIHRAIRTVKSLKFWKGSEYRTLLLYLGVVIFKDVLPQEVYANFLELFCAVTILSCSQYMKYLDVADLLLKSYIEGFIDIYGVDSVSSNIHNLCHIIKDVKKFGALPGISSYLFENFLGYLKMFMRSGNRPLSQISKRIIELSALPAQNARQFKMPKLKNEIEFEHPPLRNCKTAYKTICLDKEFTLSNSNKDKWFLTKNLEIVAMENATYCNDNFFIYGKSIRNKYDFFKMPFASSNLNIYACNSEPLLNSPKLYAVKDIQCKLFSLKYDKEYVFMPLLHTFLNK